MNERTITSLHATKTGKISTKWESYLPYYDRLFGLLQACRISLLEIGVQNGGSLETWAEYFQAGQHFVGCDIDATCGLLAFDDPRIRVVVGDINEPLTFQKISSISPAFDIVIDDGSHISADILRSFMTYFPLVKPGGLYIIEDAHSLYLDQYGGGILNESGACSFFKKLVDIIGFQFWSDQMSIATYLRTFFPFQSIPGFILEGWVESIEFRNSIITVSKSLVPGHEKLGMALVNGCCKL